MKRKSKSTDKFLAEACRDIRKFRALAAAFGLKDVVSKEDQRAFAQMRAALKKARKTK